MALTKTETVDKIEVVDTGDWSSESDKVKSICDAVHDDTTKAAYKAAQDAGL